MTDPEVVLPTPEDLGESNTDPVATHGDFHHRPPLGEEEGDS